LNYKNLSSPKIQHKTRGYKKLRVSTSKRKKGEAFSSLKVHPQLRNIFRRIGTPPPTPFTPDEFQLEALEKLKSGDVLVSAPTGSGKTWIALEAIKGCLKRGERSWYASPLKALSNSKYEEFKHELGADKVGILTGDRKENPDGPVIVGTTEILRNQLYDAMHLSSDLRVDLAVLDEAHYLSDIDRGVVWEEVLIYLPRRVKLLLLSATLENSTEIARWLTEIRSVPCSVVNSEIRPVPLFPLFLFPDGEITPLSDRRGILPQVQELSKNTKRFNRNRLNLYPHYGTIIQHLRAHNLLPAIFFLKSRADCDKALITCRPAPELLPQEENRFREEREIFLEQFPFLRLHRQLPDLIQNRAGSHHAGQLPQWKLLIEKMMNCGILEAIFSTSTVAAGVNFPARTVVIVQSDRYNGKEFADLTSTELHQMTGRAGRRGKDKVGFALILPGIYQDPFLIDTLLSSRPEPIKSQIQINFSMALNLLLSHRPEDIRELLNHSLATFQNRNPQLKLEERRKHLLRQLNDFLPQSRCDLSNPDKVIDLINYRGKKAAEEIPCHKCVHFSGCHSQGRNQVKTLLSRIKKLSRKVKKAQHWLWFDFQRHLEFLRETGFVNPDNQLNSDGVWAAQLRLDQPLLIAECIRQKTFEGISPEIMAGLIAAFVSDKTREIEVDLKKIPESETLKEAFNAMILRLKYLRNLKITRGFETPPLQIWPSIALFIWSNGLSWFELLKLIEVEEGDMAMLILRTADHLRQVCNLEKTHPSLAQKAHQALPRILREPVFLY